MIYAPHFNKNRPPFDFKEKTGFFLKKQLKLKRITETSAKIKDANILFVSLHVPNNIISTKTNSLF